MSLSFEFNTEYTADKNGDYVLVVSCHSSHFCYDFATRVMYGWGGSNISYGATPFSQLDRDVLIAMRDKLIELGGRPPELPAEPAATAPQRKFNL